MPSYDFLNASDKYNSKILACFANITSFNGSDPCSLRMRLVKNDKRVQLLLQEEQSKDDEMAHTVEDVDMFVIREY